MTNAEVLKAANIFWGYDERYRIKNRDNFMVLDEDYRDEDWFKRMRGRIKQTINQMSCIELFEFIKQMGEA